MSPTNLVRARALLAAFSLVAAAALAVACGESPNGPPTPVPGTLTVTLVTPRADDRAMVVRVTGPAGMTEVATANASYALHSRGTGTSFRAAAFGDLAGGALLRFSVPDVNRSAEYAATVVEVSDGANALRTDLAGYRLSISRP
ncbi:MAG: hypothetical protein ACJ8AO_00555 [Gemmatimonadaceae bacterium]